MSEIRLDEILPVNARRFRDEYQFARSRYEYLISRRDQLIDRLRFGVLTLNGASLVALLAAVGGKGEAAQWLGFTAATAKYSVAAFVVGIVLAGISVIIDANLYRTEAGDAFARQSSASILASRFEDRASDQSLGLMQKEMAEFHEAPLVDFQHSPLAIALQNFAGGSWLSGILLPLAASFGFS